MSDFLMRDGAPLESEGWAAVDEMVVTVMKKMLVGRRIVPMVGPLGWGVEVAPTLAFTEIDGADVVDESKVGYAALTELQQEFMLTAKRMAAAQSTPFALDLGAVAMAATKLAKAEDGYLFSGLMEKASQAELSEWETPGAPFKDIAATVAAMRAKGIDGPFAVVMGPVRHAQLASLMRGPGRTELEMVKKLAEAGLHEYVGLDADKVIVMSPQSWNVDIVVGQDVVTAYLGNEGLDHLFRLFETILLRVKRPQAVTVLK